MLENKEAHEDNDPTALIQEVEKMIEDKAAIPPPDKSASDLSKSFLE